MSNLIISIIAILTVTASQLTTQAAHEWIAPGPNVQAVVPGMHRSVAPQTRGIAFAEETTMRRLWVPGVYEAQWISPEVEAHVDATGQRHEKVIRHGYNRYHWVPGRYELVPVVRQTYLPTRHAAHDGRNGEFGRSLNSSRPMAHNRTGPSNRFNSSRYGRSHRIW